MSFTDEATSKTVRVTEGPLTDFLVHFHDVGEGIPVVYLHGSGPGASGWSNFHRNIDPVVAHGFRLVLIDLPGWSKSDPIVLSDAPRPVANAAAIKGVLDHLGIDQAHLVGNSMGGAAAIYFALEYPERVLKLVSMGAGAGGPSPFVPMPTEGIKLLMGLYREPTMEALNRLLQIFVYDPSALTQELKQKRFENIVSSDLHIKNFLESMRVNKHALLFDLTPRLPELQVPTLIVWGRDDRFVPMDAGLRLLATLAHSQMHIFNKCGHWVQWEKADEFNELLVGFLKN